MKTLFRIGSELSSPTRQRAILNDPAHVPAGRFETLMESAGVKTLRAREIKILQLNVGKVCNQTCTHCHVDAGPDRRESLSREHAERVIELLAHSRIETLDITGGAPEMNPHFRWLVEQASALGRKVIDRCNLTILLAPGFRDLPEFLAKHRVTIIASLPCYLEENCDRQRGDGVFGQSIESLQILNRLGYGIPGSGLELHLVYNPVGVSLPPDQARLETEYRQQLADRYQVQFSKLFTITNMPISRFLDDLLTQSRYDEYMQTLIDAFNPATIDSLMCRDTLSVDWQGRFYDCDFNQMLDIPIDPDAGQGLEDVNLRALAYRKIQTGNHCLGCTAGCGSSCQGTLIG